MKIGQIIAIPTGGVAKRYLEDRLDTTDIKKKFMWVPTQLHYDSYETKASSHPCAPDAQASNMIYGQKMLRYEFSPGLTVSELIDIQGSLQGGLKVQLALAITQRALEILCSVQESYQRRFDLRSSAVHGAIRSDNIFIDSKGELMFFEWGIRAVDNTKPTAEEINVNRASPNAHYADVRTLGRVLWEMIAGIRPDENSDRSQQTLTSIGLFGGNNGSDLDNLIRNMMHPPREYHNLNARWLIAMIKEMRARIYNCHARRPIKDHFDNQIIELFKSQKALVRSPISRSDLPPSLESLQATAPTATSPAGNVEVRNPWQTTGSMPVVSVKRNPRQRTKAVRSKTAPIMDLDDETFTQGLIALVCAVFIIGAIWKTNSSRPAVLVQQVVAPATATAKPRPVAIQTPGTLRTPAQVIQKRGPKTLVAYKESKRKASKVGAKRANKRAKVAQWL